MQKSFQIEFEIYRESAIKVEIPGGFALSIHTKPGKRGPSIYGTTFDGGTSLRIYDEMGRILYKDDQPRDEK